MRKPYLYMFIALTMLMTLVSGCIKENRDDCKGKVSLRFRYVGDGTTDIFPQHIKHVTMYVYSTANGRLAGVFKYDNAALDSYQGANIDLYPGQYRVICWGNALENTTIREGDRIAANGYFNNEDIDTNDPLYYGTIDINVPQTLTEQNYICPFVSSHIKIQVRLEGFNAALATLPQTASTVSLAITRLASYTDFDNVPSMDERCTYHPVLKIDSNDQNSYITQFNTMRFNDDNDITLQVLASNARSTIHEFSLAEFMTKYGISVQNRNEILIPILIRAGSAGIEITEWKHEQVLPGFDKDLTHN